MQLNTLTAISPIDGRYHKKIDELRPLFSEYGLFRFRVFVEIRWLQTLASCTKIKEIGPFSKKTMEKIDAIFKKFNEKDAKKIKTLEIITNHDIKAVEYFLKEKIKNIPELKKISEFIHFACTSDDINNLAYALMLQEIRKSCLIPLIKTIITQLKILVKKYASFPMLAHTHGQAAVPTTVGKELANFVVRLNTQLKCFTNVKLQGKFNGAIGNYNAHRIAYPNVDWPEICKKFVEKFGLIWNPYTTQIEPHDYIAEYCDSIKRINTILINLSADMWGYISLGYFKQKLNVEETGSSTMPHKINPIDFENAEGNLSFAKSLYDFFSGSLPISRWQRDLRDSTILRNLGVAFAHSLIAYKSLLIGLKKIDLDKERLTSDLNQHWEILSEAIQTILRKHGVNLPYEQLKKITRGKNVTPESLNLFIQNIELPKKIKKQLLKLTPTNYLGYAIELADKL